ncbi:MAG TPA: helicase-associated domain-containing protein [Mycobacteriales bacterium]|nr:helicase-associated domain-containing protein [Mycobacteriales bacterium]
MTTGLADQVRALPDDELAALVRLRPDLVVPVPADLAALAARAQARVSVARALDPLDRFTLEILDAVRLARVEGVTSVEAILALAAAGRPTPDPGAVRDAIERLRALLVIYGPEDELRVVPAVDEVGSPYPAGLGRPASHLDPAAAALCADPAGLRRTVLAAPPPARAVLDRLAAGPPVGSTTAGATGDPDNPVGWLVANDLLVPVSDTTVELPREVGMLLRREVGPLGPLHPAPPVPDAPVRGAESVDSAGAGQVMEAVRHAEAVLEVLSAEPAPALKSGGLGVRDLRRLARATGMPDPTTAVLVEVAATAGLLGETDGEYGGEPAFLPTPGYDAWRGQSIANRWVMLARAWLTMPRQPGLVGRRDERDRPLGALAPELERVGAPALRAAALAALSDGKPGLAPDTEQVLEVLAWRSPRRYGAAGEQVRADAVRSALAEAAVLGVTGLGALTSYGRALLDELLGAARRDPDADPLGVLSAAGPGGSGAVATLDKLVPPPVDDVLVQADLTVVVPGPPAPDLAAELSLAAEPESANVYRITADSVRRALDAGYVAGDLHQLFARRSRTPVPQALSYLVDDVARRHGGLRVGSAGAYVRSADETLLAELVADRRLGDLQLHRLAPTVLATPFASGRLLATLRDNGYAPVPEDASGAVVLRRPRARRAPVRRPLASPRSLVDDQRPLPPPRVAGIIEHLRRADAAAKTVKRAPASLRVAGNGGGTQEHTQAMAVLQQAVRDRQRVWVGYVDSHGGTAARLVRPVSIGAGYLRAEDERTETLHTFALHRITAAVVDQSS